MGKYDFDIGIIGGGAAGLYAASGSAQLGAKTLLIEKSDKLGGDCLHFGCVPSKTLIRTSGVMNLIKRSKDFGLPPVTGKKPDLAAVMKRVRKVIETIQPHDSPERFRALGAEVFFADVSFVDEHTIQHKNKKISAKSWIISTGSRPSAPPVEGLERINYWTNETVFSQKTLPTNLIVLGGGPIGLELAQAFQRLGSKVTVVEFLDQILNAEDEDIALLIRNRLESEGMKILTGTKAVKVEKDGKGIKLHVAPANGEGKTSIVKGDVLLIAAGRKPNVDGLDLDKAGIKYSPGGIETDNKLKTSIPHIYACGDVNGRFPFTHVAGHEAGIAITNAVFHLPKKINYDLVPWCTYVDPEIASIGLNEKRARKEGIKYRILEQYFSENDRAIAEDETTGKIKVLLSEKKIIGCQIIGPHAGELIHEWVTAINGKTKLSTLASMIHVYPTLSEISKRASGSFYAGKLYSKKTKKILRALFGYRGKI